MASASKPVQVPIASFEESAPPILRDLQEALSELVTALPGRVSRAVDLQRALGVDKKLGWQLYTFINAPDPMAEVANVPAAPSLQRALAASVRCKVPKSVTDRAVAAFDRFEDFVAEQCADRSELVTLARGFLPDRDQQHELKVRRDLFRGTAHVWGVQAATYTATAVFHPSTGAQRGNDALALHGYIGLQRLRRDATLALDSPVAVYDDPVAGSIRAREARSANPGAPADRHIEPMRVLREYSSEPLPELVPRQNADGSHETEMVFPASGRAGAVTLYAAQHVALATTEPQAQHGVNTVVRLPMETLVAQLVVPAGTTDPGTARASVYGRRGKVDRVHELRTVDLLPQRETIAYLGTFQVPPPIPGVPNHSEAMRHMLESLGWMDTEYDVYRCTVKYPALHTMIRIAALVSPPE